MTLKAITNAWRWAMAHMPRMDCLMKFWNMERTALRQDKQLEAIRNLLERGTRLVIQLATNQRKLQASVTELTNSL